MKDDNRGFSLVELIVVVAILAILLGVMAANIGRISGYRAKECRTKVVSSLENGRLVTLSKSRGGSYIGNTKTYLVFVNKKCCIHFKLLNQTRSGRGAHRIL